MAPLVKMYFTKIKTFTMNAFFQRLISGKKPKEGDKAYARRIEVPNSTFFRWKRARVRPNLSIDDIEKIAEKAGLDPAWLAFGEEGGKMEGEKRDQSAWKLTDRSFFHQRIANGASVSYFI